MPVRSPKKSPLTLRTPSLVQKPKTTSVAKPTLPAAGTWGLPPAPANDGFSPGLTVNPRALEGLNPQGTPTPFDPQFKAAIDTYSEKVRLILGHDAMAMARGTAPTLEGMPLSATQQTQLKNAAVDLLQDLPVGFLAPEFMAKVQSKLNRAHLTTRDLPTTKLRDLGSIGGDIAQSLIDGLKKKSPATFYSLAASAAVAAGYVAYSQGSDALKKLGVKPEFSQSLFNHHLNAKVSAEWQAKFRDFKAQGSLDATLPTKNAGTFSAGLSVDSKAGFTGANLGYTYRREHWSLSARTNFNDKGFASSRVDGEFHQGPVSATSSLSFVQTGFDAASARVTWAPNAKLNLSSGLDYSNRESKLSMTTEVSYRPQPNLSFALSARADSKGGSWAGIGARLTF